MQSSVPYDPMVPIKHSNVCAGIPKLGAIHDIFGENFHGFIGIVCPREIFDYMYINIHVHMLCPLGYQSECFNLEIHTEKWIVPKIISLFAMPFQYFI